MKEHIKEAILAAAESSLPLLKTIRNELYQHPEIGGEESYASARLIEVLQAHGYAVTKDYGGIPYAFRATASSTKSGPTVALFAEYDALPELGHACGHNLICTAALSAAISLCPVIEELGGTVIVYGTPGEENLCSKTTLAEQGLFDEADAALMAHPNPVTCGSGKTRAIESLQIEFFGRTAHAGTAPEAGINALDAAVQCYQMIRKERLKYPDTNVNGILSDGGTKASTIPGYSCLKYLTRAWDMDGLAALRNMVEKCARKAAEETGCTWKISNNEATNAAMLTNQGISRIFDQYLLQFGEPEFTHQDVIGSTDMGDVSWRVPSIHAWVGLDCPDTQLHTKAFAERTLSTAGDIFIERCGKALACAAAEILMDQNFIAEIKSEFRQCTNQ